VKYNGVVYVDGKISVSRLLRQHGYTFTWNITQNVGIKWEMPAYQAQRFLQHHTVAVSCATNSQS